jgi:hypothetical protein
MRAGSPNGKTVTFVTKAINKDLKVADNGDGTLTLVMLMTGNAVLYADGKSIGSDTGQVRIELLIDDSGTPTVLSMTKSSWILESSRSRPDETTTSAQRSSRRSSEARPHESGAPVTGD